jgi:hydrogenase maturation protein HypF
MIYGLRKNEKEALRAVKSLKLCSETEAKVIFRMYDRNVNAVVSTSAGRLFDAVSAILGIRRCSTYEGEASCALQFAAEAYRARQNTGEQPDGESLSASVQNTVRPTDGLFCDLLERRLNGEDAGKLAFDFHRELARFVLHTCLEIRTQTKRNVVALSGGCFQNLLLLELCKKGLEANGFTVLIHHLVPPNDGGIALGQAVVAASLLSVSEKKIT